MSRQFSAELLSRLLAHHLAIDPDTVAISAIEANGLDEFFLAQSNQGDFILQIAPANDAPQLFFEKASLQQLPVLYALIQTKTTVPISKIIAYDFSRALIDRDFLILKARNGITLKQIKKMEHRQFNKVLQQLGESLQQLHAISGQTYGYAGPHNPMEAQSTWKQAFGLMWQRLISDIVRAGVYTSADADRLTRLWETHQAHFDRNIPPGLLQMDMCTDHFLIDQEANLTAILNFSQVLWGDPELDFAVADYYGIYASAFWQGYGRPRPDDPDSQIRRRFYLMYEIQKHIPISVWRDKDPNDAEQAKQMVLTIADNLASSHPQKQ